MVFSLCLCFLVFSSLAHVFAKAANTTENREYENTVFRHTNKKYKSIQRYMATNRQRILAVNQERIIYKKTVSTLFTYKFKLNITRVKRLQCLV